MKYNVLVGQIQIGVLEVRDDGMYKYTVVEEGVGLVKAKVSLISEMLISSDEWQEPIPFFKNRIENAARFEVKDEISYQTDPFKLVRIS